MTVGRLRINAGFALLVAALVYLDEGRLLWITGAAALLHEAGHYAALRLSGGRVGRIELSAGGISMVPAASPRFGYKLEVAAVLAGPALSLLSALLFCLLGDGADIFLAIGGLCLVQGLFNLLPAEGLDGGRALSLLLESAGVARVHAVLRITTAVTAVAVAAGGAALFWLSGWNLTLLLAGAYSVASLWAQPAWQNRRAAAEGMASPATP